MRCRNHHNPIQIAQLVGRLDTFKKALSIQTPDLAVCLATHSTAQQASHVELQPAHDTKRRFSRIDVRT